MFFFFKQKTAYEMRISDWSSDVCSSDLNCPQGSADDFSSHDMKRVARFMLTTLRFPRRHSARSGDPGRCRLVVAAGQTPGVAVLDAAIEAIVRRGFEPYRSEEHTSELQSLMRISYAVFCLEQKKKHRRNTMYY